MFVVQLREKIASVPVVSSLHDSLTDKNQKIKNIEKEKTEKWNNYDQKNENEANYQM